MAIGQLVSSYQRVVFAHANTVDLPSRVAETLEKNWADIGFFCDSDGNDYYAGRLVSGSLWRPDVHLDPTDVCGLINASD